jgi:YggT family protein
MAFLINIIQIIVQILTLLIIVHVFIGYFLDPFHPIRRTIGSLVEPMLAPIRRIVPAVGMLDFSPFVLLILIQLIGRALILILINL